MTTLTIGVALLVVGVALGAMFVGIPVDAGAPAPTAVSAGDANGDGRVDISDALRILNSLFSDGPPPVACADSPALLERVASLDARMAQTEATLDVLASGDFALWIDRVRFGFDSDCPRGASTREPGYFGWDHTPFVVEKGVLIGERENPTGDRFADEIAFTTNREADLAITYTAARKFPVGPPGASMALRLDGNTIDGVPQPFFGTDPPEIRRVFVPDVPPGEHRLSLSAFCFFQEPYNQQVHVEFLTVQYLE